MKNELVDYVGCVDCGTPINPAMNRQDHLVQNLLEKL